MSLSSMTSNLKAAKTVSSVIPTSKSAIASRINQKKISSFYAGSLIPEYENSKRVSNNDHDCLQCVDDCEQNGRR